MMDTPLMITNTLSVGIVHHAVIRYGAAKSVETGKRGVAQRASGGGRDLGRGR